MLGVESLESKLNPCLKFFLLCKKTSTIDIIADRWVLQAFLERAGVAVAVSARRGGLGAGLR